MKKEEIINALIKIFKAGISFEYIGDFYCKFKYIGLLFKVNYEHISVERYVDQYTLGSSEFTSHIENQLKKNKDEEAELICKRKQDEAWTEFKKIFYNMETKEDKAKKYAEGLNKVGQSFDIYYVEQAFLDGWEECMKYLQSLPLDEASNRILYHETKIDKQRVKS